MNRDPALQEQLQTMLSKSRRSLKAARIHIWFQSCPIVSGAADW
jgi:hypothetical protein